jgi:FtsZ-binding cell division protein ZapB
MSEFALEGEIAHKSQSESALAAEHASEPHSEPHGAADGHDSLTLSANDFSALEERILRAVEVVRRERQGRITAEERAARAEAQVRDLSPQLEQLEKEMNAMRTERDQVRGRVERLLGQLDALEL